MINSSAAVGAKNLEDYFREDFKAQKLQQKLLADSQLASTEKTNPAEIEDRLQSLNEVDDIYLIYPRIRWQGKLAAEFGLSGTVTKDQFKLLCEGKHPLTGEQLIKSVKARTKTDRKGEEYQTLSRRAGLPQSISAPKSVSLMAVHDLRVIGAHTRAAAIALDTIEEYTHVKMGNNKPPELTGKSLRVLFLHFDARPDAKTGYAAWDLHSHCPNLNIGFDFKGQPRAIEFREVLRSQKLATAVYRAELVKEMTKIGYEMEINPKTGAPEVVGISREYIEASSPRHREIVERAKELGIKSTKEVATNYRQSKKFDRAEMMQRRAQLEEAFGFQAAGAAEKAFKRTKQIELEEQAMTEREQIDSAQTKAIKAKEAADFVIAQISERKNSDQSKKTWTTWQTLLTDAINYAKLEITVDVIKTEFAERYKRGELDELDLTRRGTSKRVKLAELETELKAENRNETVSQTETVQKTAKSETAEYEADTENSKQTRQTRNINTDEPAASEKEIINQTSKTYDEPRATPRHSFRSTFDGTEDLIGNPEIAAGGAEGINYSRENQIDEAAGISRSRDSKQFTNDGAAITEFSAGDDKNGQSSIVSSSVDNKRKLDRAGRDLLFGRGDLEFVEYVTDQDDGGDSNRASTGFAETIPAGREDGKSIVSFDSESSSEQQKSSINHTRDAGGRVENGITESGDAATNADGSSKLSIVSAGYESENSGKGRTGNDTKSTFSALSATSTVRIDNKSVESSPAGRRTKSDNSAIEPVNTGDEFIREDTGSEIGNRTYGNNLSVEHTKTEHGIERERSIPEATPFREQRQQPIGQSGESVSGSPNLSSDGFGENDARRRASEFNRIGRAITEQSDGKSSSDAEQSAVEPFSYRITPNFADGQTNYSKSTAIDSKSAVDLRQGAANGINVPGSNGIFDKVTRSAETATADNANSAPKGATDQVPRNTRAEGEEAAGILANTNAVKTASGIGVKASSASEEYNRSDQQPASYPANFSGESEAKRGGEFFSQSDDGDVSTSKKQIGIGPNSRQLPERDEEQGEFVDIGVERGDVSLSGVEFSVSLGAGHFRGDSRTGDKRSSGDAPPSVGVQSKASESDEKVNVDGEQPERVTTTADISIANIIYRDNADALGSSHARSQLDQQLSKQQLSPPDDTNNDFDSNNLVSRVSHPETSIEEVSVSRVSQIKEINEPGGGEQGDRVSIGPLAVLQPLDVLPHTVPTADSNYFIREKQLDFSDKHLEVDVLINVDGSRTYNRTPNVLGIEKFDYSIRIENELENRIILDSYRNELDASLERIGGQTTINLTESFGGTYISEYDTNWEKTEEETISHDLNNNFYESAQFTNEQSAKINHQAAEAIEQLQGFAEQQNRREQLFINPLTGHPLGSVEEMEDLLAVINDQNQVEAQNSNSFGQAAQNFPNLNSSDLREAEEADFWQKDRNRREAQIAIEKAEMRAGMSEEERNADDQSQLEEAEAYESNNDEMSRGEVLTL